VLSDHGCDPISFLSFTDHRVAKIAPCLATGRAICSAHRPGVNRNCNHSSMRSVTRICRLDSPPVGGTEAEEQNKDSDATAEDGLPGGVHIRRGLRAFQVSRP